MQWRDAGDEGRGVMREGAGECGDRVGWMVEEDVGERPVLGLGRGGVRLEGLREADRLVGGGMVRPEAEVCGCRPLGVVAIAYLGFLSSQMLRLLDFLFREG